MGIAQSLLKRLGCVMAIGAVTLLVAQGALLAEVAPTPQVPPILTASFRLSVIVAGTTSQLTIELRNPNTTASSTTAVFTNILPPGVVVAPTPEASTTCGGAVSATVGGSTVSLASGSTLPDVCTITVNVTSAVVGTHLNTIPAGALQTSAGNNAAPATATLIVNAAPPPGCSAITLAPSPLPNGTLAVAYSQSIGGSGGIAPYVFGVTLATMPSGLTLTPAGLLSGTPTGSGSWTFTVRGTDNLGCFSEIISTIVIATWPVPPPVCPVITLGPSPMPSGTVGVAYSEALTGSGGAMPYLFGVTLGTGTLPAGLTLTSAGLLAGTPTTAAPSTFTIRSTDSLGCFAEVATTVVIAAAPVPPPACPVITLTPGTVANGLVGHPFSQTFAASAGTAPYTFGVVGGALPRGVVLTMTGGLGLLSGTPTTNGTYAFVIRATDANGCVADRAYTVSNSTSVPTMPEIFYTILAVVLTSVGYLHLRRQSHGEPGSRVQRI